jgi:YidC/Oxa1 family membrane protein insertase
MEKRLVVAIGLSVVVLFGYQYFVSKYYPPVKVTAPLSDSAEKTASAPEKQEVKPAEKKAAETFSTAVKKDEILQGKDVTIETDEIAATFDTAGAVLKSYKLLKHKEKNKNIELVWQNPKAVRPYKLEIPSLKFFDNIIYQEKRDGQNIEFKGTANNGMVITKKYSLEKNSFKINFELQISLRSTDKSEIKDARVYLGTGTANNLPALSEVKLTGEEIKSLETELLFLTNSHYIDEKIVKNDLKDNGSEIINDKGKLSWTAVKDKYYLSIFIMDENAGYNSFARKETVSVKITEVSKDGKVEIRKFDKTIYIPTAGIILPLVKAAETKTFNIQCYRGPLLYKQLDAMKKGIYKNLDYGWFSWLGIAMLLIMKFFFGIFNNYGFAIIMLTILIKAVLWFPTQSSLKSMKKMQELNPHIQALREQYKNDTQRLNEEMMKLYKEKKVNPLGGCLPMLAQLPIFVSLWSLLSNAYELKGAPFIFWVKDLSAPDIILVLIALVTQLVQSLITPTAGQDPKQAKMMMFVTLGMFAFFFLYMAVPPAGVMIYWIVLNVLSIAQQYMINISAPKTE